MIIDIKTLNFPEELVTRTLDYLEALKVTNVEFKNVIALWEESLDKGYFNARTLLPVTVANAKARCKESEKYYGYLNEFSDSDIMLLSVLTAVLNGDSAALAMYFGHLPEPGAIHGEIEALVNALGDEIEAITKEMERKHGPNILMVTLKKQGLWEEFETLVKSD